MPAAPRRLDVFAVEDDAVQLCWASLPAGDWKVFAAATAVELTSDGGPGAVVVGGLPADREVEVVLEGERGSHRLRTRTLPAPPGRLLSRVATIGDIHLGERAFGHLPRVREAADREPYPLRCARAAVEELLTWGPDLVVVKGDLTLRCTRAELEQAASLLGGLGVPVLVVPGNHDGGNHRRDDPAAVLAEHGVELITTVAWRDLPGVRIVAASTVAPGRGYGRVGPVLGDVAEALRDAPAAGLLCLHHQLQRAVLPAYWPPGVPGPESRRLLRAVAAANPATLVTSGHTHRHRRRSHGPLVVTEVGSTKDYPGTWAGYAVHEGGVRQVVRRVGAPDAISWTERTRRMGLGQWGRWSPGSLADRCFTHPWADGTPTAPPTAPPPASPPDAAA